MTAEDLIAALILHIELNSERDVEVAERAVLPRQALQRLGG